MKLKHFLRKPVWFFRGEIDAARLKKVFPEDFFSKNLLQPDEYQQLKPVYDRYIKDVSSKEMAVSWQTSCFLYAAAKTRDCKKILDLGSGFSSYLFRAYAINSRNGASIYSVDDNDFWLEKTRTFLTEHEMPVDQLSTLSDFDQQNKSGFDLIFHDLGSMATRAELLSFAISLLEPGGMLVLDDMHKTRYRSVAAGKVKKAGLCLYSIRKYTLDELGRFAEIATSYNEMDA